MVWDLPGLCCNMSLFRFGPLAQLGERLVRNQEVGGSIPPRSTKPFSELRNLGLEEDLFVSILCLNREYPSSTEAVNSLLGGIDSSREAAPPRPRQHSCAPLDILNTILEEQLPE
jgi:hypothetical protein